MIDVGDKPITHRVATARGVVKLSADTLHAIEEGKIAKGDVLQVAKIAGIQAAKETSRILPLCHPIPLEHVEVDFEIHRKTSEIEITATASADWKTGVEMEAMAAVSAAALTIYDMCKSRERGITISDIGLTEKRGGKSGTWVRNQ
jgi:cyclic pyranopterin monophosphate synthase